MGKCMQKNGKYKQKECVKSKVAGEGEKLSPKEGDMVFWSKYKSPEFSVVDPDPLRIKLFEW